MKKKSKKRGGFSLVEVVLSMALIAILSIGVYNAYLILIRQTKDGQVKQGAALAGKKIVEEVKAGEFEKDDDGNFKLTENITIDKTSENLSLRLDKNYMICENQEDNNYVYTADLSIKQTNVTFEKYNPSNDKNILNYELYITNTGISDNKNNKCENIEYQEDKKWLYFYLETIDENKNLIIKDYSGNTILQSDIGKIETIDNIVNINMNLKDYTDDKSINLIIDNKNQESNCETNIYLKKSTNIDANVKVNNGQVNVYNNRAFNESEKSGDLYSINVEIKDKKDKSLFKGYLNKNVGIK